MEQSIPPEHSHQWPQFLTVSTCLFLAVSSGVASGWPSPAIPKLKQGEMGFDVDDLQISYIVMIYPLGYVIADFLGPNLVDNLGRKNSMLILTIPTIVAWLLLVFAKNISTVYISRLMSGVCEGGAFMFIPMYICEISEPKVRGSLGMGYSTAHCVGLFFIACYGSYIPLRMSALISIVFPILFFVSFVWMPQSPYFLIMKGNIEGARNSLKKLRRMHDVEPELRRLKSDVERQLSESGTMRDLFACKSTLKALIVLLGLRTLQQFSGGWSVIYYNQIIFEEIGGRLSPVESSIVFYAAVVVVSSSGIILVDRYGRRPLLMWSAGGISICLLAQAIFIYMKHQGVDMSHIQWIALSGMICYTLALGLGLLAIPSLMAGELFPTNMKARAIGIANIYMGVCISIVTKLFIWLDTSFGMYVPFLLFSLCSMVGLLFVYYFVPETKGKTLEQIQQQLKGVRISIAVD